MALDADATGLLDAVEAIEIPRVAGRVTGGLLVHDAPRISAAAAGVQLQIKLAGLLDVSVVLPTAEISARYAAAINAVNQEVEP